MMTSPQTLALTLAALILSASPVLGAFVEQTGDVILSDDFEEISDPGGNLYQVGDSPVADGPWAGTSATSSTNGNNFLEVSARPDGQAGQAAKYVAKFSSATELTYHDSSNNRPTAYYYDFLWLPGPSTRSESSRYNQFWIYDSNGAKGLLRIDAKRVDPAEGEAYNELILKTGDGETNLGAISATEFTQIHLSIAPGDEVTDPWSYSLWIDGQQKALDASLTLLSADARKGDIAQFKARWQGAGVSYVDDYNQRTDGFATPIPEPGSLGLIGLGAVLAAARRRH